MNQKHNNIQTIEKDIKNESAELNGVKVNHQNFEIPRSTYEMIEQTCQIA